MPSKLEFLDLVMAALATYRLTQLVGMDDGPFDVILRMRQWLKSHRAWWEQVYKSSLPVTWTHFFASIIGPTLRTTEKLIECPFCLGVWFAALCLALVLLPSLYGNVILYLFAIAGLQSFLQELSNK